MRLDGAAEGVADALDVAVNALPDAAAGDTGVLGVGCEAAALKDAPVDVGAGEAVTVGAVAAGGAVSMPEAPVAGVAEIAEVVEVAAAANGADTEDGAVVGLEAPTADVGTD